MRSLPRFGLLGILCAAILSCGTATSAQADNWNGGAGNWSVPSNWSAGLPTGTSAVGISATSNPVASSVLLDINATVSSVSIDNTSTLTLGSGNTLNVTGSNGLTSIGQLTLDSGSTANIALSSSSFSTITINNGATMNTGAFDVLGGSINGTLNSGDLEMGAVPGGGTITIGTGGVVNAGATNIDSVFTVNGGTLNASSLQDGQFSAGASLQVENGGSVVVGTTAANGNFSNQDNTSIGPGSLTVNGNVFNAPGESTGAGISVSSGGVLNVTGTFYNDANYGNGEFPSSFSMSGGKAVIGGDFNNASLNYINFGQTTSGVSPNVSSLSGGSVLSVGGNFNNDAGVQTPVYLNLEGGSVLNVTGNLNNNQGVYEIQPGVFVYTPSVITLQQGSVISVQGSAINSGDISIDNTSVLSAHSGFTQTAGSTVVDGNLNAGGTGVSIQGGSLSGTGTVNGNVTNGALVMPGDAPGTLSITGNYTQMSAGTLMEEIASSSSFGVLDVSGMASLNGTLNIDLLSGFTPTLGESFTIMDFASLSGEFSAVDGLEIGDGLQFDLFYDPHDVRLVVESSTATPEPSALLLLAAGLVALLGFSGKRGAIAQA